MEFGKIILCTEAPQNTGLAYYYYLAFRDLLSEDRVVLIDEGERKYDASIFARIERKMSYLSGKSSIEKMNLILGACKGGEKNVVILFNTSNIRYEEIKKLSANKDIYLIHLLSDNPYGMYQSRMQLTFQTLPLFDMVCVFARALMPVLYQLGARRVERLPFGYCKYTHFVSENISEPEFPQSVYYFGTWTPVIEKWLEYLKDFDLHIEGSFWKNATNLNLRKIGSKLNPNTDKNMSIMAHKAGVVVNFTRASHGCFHTMKTFELTVAGAAVISNYSDEQSEFFKPDYAMTYFNTPDELVQRVGDLLTDKKKNMYIRTNALKEALPHSYHTRAENLLFLLKSNS